MSEQLLRRFTAANIDNEIYIYLIPWMVDEIRKYAIIFHEWQQRNMKHDDKRFIDELAQNYIDFLFPPEYFPDNMILTTKITDYLKTRISNFNRNSHYVQIFHAVHSNQTGNDIEPNYFKNLGNLKNRILAAYLRVHINKDMPINDFRDKIGYKDKKKRLALSKANYGSINDEVLKTFPINRFPLKQNIKNYSLHTIAPKDTYMMDLMFDNHNEFCYLVLINVNTRKLYVRQTNIQKDEKDNSAKTAPKVKAALIAITREIHKNHKEIKYLKGDDEGAFQSELLTTYYAQNNIKFLRVIREALTRYPNFMKNNKMAESIQNKSKVKQTSLNIIDRVIRTIRDIAYNMELEFIEPEDMENIVWQYNNAPHKTLSKYAGQPVSPNDVDKNEELEKFIIKRIDEENYNILSKPSFSLKPNQPVKVYNERYDKTKRRTEFEPLDWHVYKRIGPFGLYKLRTNDGQEEIKSRYQIDYI